MASMSRVYVMKFKLLIDNDAYDLESVRIEWQIHRLCDQLHDCIQTIQVVDEVLQLVPTPPDLIINMYHRGLKYGE